MEKKDAIKKILMIFLIIITLLLSALTIWIVTILKEVKDIDLSLGTDESVCYLIDSDGNSKKVYGGREKIDISKLNTNTINAFISIEDKNFFKHKGINVKRIVKSGIDNILAKKVVAGGSTITQQLVKNKFLSKDKTLKRKVQEIYLSLKIEKENSKEEILSTYLNEIYYGSGAYGIEEASQRYFSKSASDLSLTEGCILAGCINSPSYYSPITNKENCMQRRNLVLREMQKDGYISENEYSNAVTESITIEPKNISKNTKLDLYDQFAINEVSKILNINENQIYDRGLRIYTGKSKAKQEKLEKIINDDSFYHKNSYGNIADSLSIIIDNKTNCVTAIAGRSKYNLTDLKRQPGSLIKPILVYAPAMEEGLISPVTQIYDGYIDYDGYSPNDVGGYKNEYVSIEEAISKSLNIPAVKVCNMLGLDKCKKYASKCGLIFDDNDDGYALALGGTTYGFTLQNILDSYSPLIFNGKYEKSNIILKIENKMNMTIYSGKVTKSDVLKEDTAYLMTKTLQKSTKNGTSSKLSNLQYDIAGKTGTVAVKGTNYNTDCYSLAYTTADRMAVWFGNYSMEKEYHLEGANNGGTYATMMLKSICDSIYKGSPPTAFEIPQSVVELNVDDIKLRDEHKVYLADDSIPDRYKSTALFSTRYLPEYSKTSYIDNLKINLQPIDDAIEITFEANKYITYDLYREQAGNKYLLKTYKNKDMCVNYLDSLDNVDLGKVSYYVECYNLITDTRFTSSIESLYIDNSLKNSYKLDASYDWLFV